MSDDLKGLDTEIRELAAVPSDRLFATAVEHLLDRHPRRRAAAAILLTRSGGAVVTDLLREAFRPGRPAAHRVKLLDLVERIGEPPDVAQWMTLRSCCSPRYPKSVREKIANVLARVGPPNRR